MEWMFIIGISGILSGYILSKIERTIIIVVLVFIVLSIPFIQNLFDELFEQYSYWITIPVLIHLLFIELTVRFLKKK